MFKLAPVAIAILDRQFKYESVNPAYCALTGYAADELVGQPGDMVLTDSSGRPSDRSRSRDLRPGGNWTKQLSIRKKDGSTAQVEWQIATESISGVRILVATDITQQLAGRKRRASSCWRASARRAPRRSAAIV